MKRFQLIGLAGLLMSTSGCLGGGGSDAPDLFTGFSDVRPSSEVRITGLGLVAQYEMEPSTGALTVGASEPVDIEAIWRTNSGGALSALTIRTTPDNPFGELSTGASFDEDDGDGIVDGDLLFPEAADYIALATDELDQFALVADPFAQGFEYQTFGIWEHDANATSGVVGVGSVGSPTDARLVPSIGSATYAGSAAGLYVDSSQDDFLTFADLSAELNFGTSDLSIGTTNTTAVNSDTLVTSDMPSLDFAGAGTIDQPFSVAIANGDSSLTGTLNGQLYGPAAEEIGGTFNMTGDAGRYLGAFGAVQVP